MPSVIDFQLKSTTVLRLAFCGVSPGACDGITGNSSIESIDEISTSSDPIYSVARLSDLICAAVIRFPRSSQLGYSFHPV